MNEWLSGLREKVLDFWYRGHRCRIEAFKGNDYVLACNCGGIVHITANRQIPGSGRHPAIPAFSSVTWTSCPAGRARMRLEQSRHMPKAKALR